jgi:hypothetical protein
MVSHHAAVDEAKGMDGSILSHRVTLEPYLRPRVLNRVYLE